MDKVTKALKKARQEGHGRPADTQTGSRRHPRPRTARSKHTIEISYEKTLVVSCSLQTLLEHRVVAAVPKHPQADVYRILRAQVLNGMQRINAKTLGITSANAGNGKSLTAANLAVSLAMVETHTVLLVDLDLRRPSLHEYFGLSDSHGLSDYLFNGVELPNCLVNPGINRLVVLPAGRALYNSSEILSSPAMSRLADELRNRYPDRLIVYDLPPLLSSDDFLVFFPHIDASLLVVQEGTNKAGEVQRCLDLLSGNDLIGLVLNKSGEQNLYPYY